MDIGQVGADLIANPLAQLVAAIASAATGWRIYKNQFLCALQMAAGRLDELKAAGAA